MRKIVLAVLFGVGCASGLAAVASAQPLAVPIPQHVDPLLQNLPNPLPSDAHLIGMWSPPPASNPKYNWPLVAMHMIVMPNGKVVTFGSPVQPTGFTIKGEVFDVWNPWRGFPDNHALNHRTLDNPNVPSTTTRVDSFCAASMLLGTGQLLTSGGNTRTPIPNTQNFDYTLNNATSLVNMLGTTVLPGTRMASPRYYATQTKLADGRVLITGGSVTGSDPIFNYQDYPIGGPYTDPVQNHNGQMSGAPEVYTPSLSGGTWDTLTGAGSVNSTGGYDAFGPRDNRWFYPRQWVGPDGKVFGISTHQMWYLDPSVQPNGVKGSISSPAVLATLQFKSGVGTTQVPNVGPTSTAVMYDIGKILLVGGNGRLNADTTHDWTPSSPFASVIDINTPGLPQGHNTPTTMHYGRQWANATVLPNGTVIVTGGTATGNSNDTSGVHWPGPVHVAEIWNPSNESWTIGPSASVTRVYHSTAVLLPNGTVLTAGSGGPPGWPVPYPADENLPRYDAEVYYPAYLFQSTPSGPVLATRPQILSMDTRQFAYAQTGIRVEVSTGQTIVSGALIGLGSTTHSFDMGQRRLPVSVSQSGTLVTLSAPANSNLAPPGYYLLFLSNASGVPSEGVIVAIGSNVAAPPKYRAAVMDLNADGLSDFAVMSATSQWHTRVTHDNGTGDLGVISPYGGGNQVPFLVDMAGHGSSVPATWDPGTGVWSIYGYGSFPLGSPGDVPVAGDMNGDGITDFAVMGPATSVWSIRYSFANGLGIVTTLPGLFGGGNQVPFLVDIAGNGSAVPATWDPNSGVWAIYGYGSFALGSPGDVPAVGDINGDGVTDVAVMGPSTSVWNIRLNFSNGLGTFTTLGSLFGGGSQVPFLVDIGGTGKAVPATWDPGSGVWAIYGYGSFALGSPGDVPARPAY